MKKLLLASLLLLPLAAQACFVEDCKTAYVQGDLFTKIGLVTDRRGAEAPFQSRCVCISQSVKNDYDYELFSKYIEFQGRIVGVPASERARAYRVISDCDEKIVAKQRESYVSKRQAQLNACMSKIINESGESEAIKQYARNDIKESMRNGGNWSQTDNPDGRGLSIKAVDNCY